MKRIMTIAGVTLVGLALAVWLASPVLAVIYEPYPRIWKGTQTYQAAVTFQSTVQLDGGTTLGDTLTVEAIVGGDSSLGITGIAGSSGAGGAVPIAGGAGDGTGAGGAASLAGGASGSGATGNGGAASVVGGAAASTDGTGGAASLTGGVATGTGTGGAVTITSGASAGASGTAGAVAIDAGAAAGGTAGNITIGATNAGLVTITSGVLRVEAASDLTAADVNLSKAAIQAAAFWGVDTSSNAVDVDFGDDAALDAADIGSRKIFAVTTGHATQALTVTAGASGVTTVVTHQAGPGSTCEDTGDLIECIVIGTGSATCMSYCAD